MKALMKVAAGVGHVEVQEIPYAQLIGREKSERYGLPFEEIIYLSSKPV